MTNFIQESITDRKHHTPNEAENEYAQNGAEQQNDYNDRFDRVSNEDQLFYRNLNQIKSSAGPTRSLTHKKLSRGGPQGTQTIAKRQLHAPEGVDVAPRIQLNNQNNIKRIWEKERKRIWT